MKLTNLLSGTRILESTRSKYNGRIKVIRDFAWGTYIQANGFTQSGGIVEKIWKETLKEVLQVKPTINSCLILGLGGGSAAKIISSYWVGAKITGVDIDEKIVDLGKKYLDLNESEIKIQIDDVNNFIKKVNRKYDLILVDLYNGKKFPKEFVQERFINNIKRLVKKDGIVIFNKLKKDKFGKSLEKYFKKVDYINPIANVMFVCYN